MPDIVFMKKLTSSIIGVVVALVILDGGASYYIGIKGKARFEELVAFANEIHGPFYQILSYQKGIFKSEVITTTTINVLNAPTLKVKHTIYHGPIIFGASKKRPLDMQLAVIRSEPVEMSPTLNIPFTTYSVFKFNGVTKTETTGTAFEIKRPNYQISSPGWTTQAKISKDLRQVEGDFILPEITVLAMGMPVVFKDIRILTKQNRESFDLWLGDFKFSMGDAIQKDQKIEISQLKLEMGAQPSNQVVNFTWGLDFTKVSMAALAYGPLHFKMEIANIDPEGLKLLSSNEKNVSVKSDPQVATQEKARVENALQKILLKQPKVTILPGQITIPQGDIKVDAQLTVGGPDIILPIDKDNVLKTVDGYFHAVAPKDILRQGLIAGVMQEMQKDPNFLKMTPEQKQQLMNQQLDLKIQKLKADGIVTEKENEFDIKISITKGKWVVNGKVVEHPLQ